MSLSIGIYGELERFNETLLPDEEDFQSSKHGKITNADYKHAKKVLKNCEKKNLGYYHNLYVQSNTLLADVFESLCNKYNEIYDPDPAHFLAVLRLACS